MDIESEGVGGPVGEFGMAMAMIWGSMIVLAKYFSHTVKVEVNCNNLFRRKTNDE